MSEKTTDVLTVLANFYTLNAKVKIVLVRIVKTKSGDMR